MSRFDFSRSRVRRTVPVAQLGMNEKFYDFGPFRAGTVVRGVYFNVYDRAGVSSNVQCRIAEGTEPLSSVADMNGARKLVDGKFRVVLDSTPGPAAAWVFVWSEFDTDGGYVTVEVAAASGSSNLAGYLSVDLLDRRDSGFGFDRAQASLF